MHGRTGKEAVSGRPSGRLPITPPENGLKSPSRACSVEGCCKPSVARGLCCTHYQRFRRQGDPHAVKQRAGRRTWTPDQDALLIRELESMAGKLGRSPWACLTRFRRLKYGPDR